MAVDHEELLGDAYVFQTHIGSGAAGHVYRFHQVSMDRAVAVKILRHELITDPEFRDRFQREARTAGQLVHPNIPHVHEFLQRDAGLAIVMQYVDGDSLTERLGRRGITGAQSLHVLRSVAAALDHAHRHRVLHRDVKPANILLERDGDGVWLTDFGLAKPIDVTALTQTGREMMGTFPYMAPELLRGGDATRSTDIYAFAVTAYQALTGGSHPLPGSRDRRVAAPQLRNLPPLPLLPADDEAIPALYAALARGLAASPGDRPASAGELVDELEVALAASASAGSRNPAFTQDRPPVLIAPIDDGAESTVIAGIAERQPAPPPTPVEVTPAEELVDVDEPIEPSLERRPSHRRRRVIGAIAATTVLATAGVGAAAALMPDDAPPPAAAARLSAGGASFLAEPGTRPAADAKAVGRIAFPGISQLQPIAAVGDADEGVALLTIGEGRTALSPARAARGRTITVAGGTARRFARGDITTVIAQTPTLVVRLACTVPHTACERAIDTLELTDGQTLQGDPIADVERRLKATLQIPRGSRQRLALPTRDLARRRARARSIAGAYGEARDSAAAIAKARPRDRDLAALPGELAAAADAYSDIAAAAKNRSAPGDRRALAALRAADKDLSERRTALEGRGYELPWPSTADPGAAVIERRKKRTVSSSASTSSAATTSVTPSETQTPTYTPTPSGSGNSAGSSGGSGGSGSGGSESSNGCNELGPC